MSVQSRFDALVGVGLVRMMLQPWAWRRFRTSAVGNRYWGVYSSAAEARAHAAKVSDHVGYDHQGPAELYRDMIGRLSPCSYPMMFWLAKICGEGSARSLLDFGGHFGIKFYNFRKFIDLPKDFSWTVFDVPQVVDSGRTYASAKGETGIFFADSTVGRTDDIFFASGSLQYVAGSVADEITRLGSRPRHILIGSLPVNRTRYFTMQNIGVTISPYQIFARDDILSNLGELGYDLVDSWEEPGKACHIPLDPDHSLNSYHGFYFRDAREPRRSQT